MIILVNFADKKFRRKQKWNSFSAKFFGGIDKVFEYTPEDISKEFLKKNKESIKYTSKGFGNYYWKPYVVEKAMDKIEYGEYLIYADSGSFFLKSLKPLIATMEKNKKEMCCFQLPLVEKQWTKRDAFILTDSDKVLFSETNQILATYFILKKTEKAIFIIQQWKNYCLDSRILSDDNNACGTENYPEFIEHRHDQSVLSLVCKKNKEDILILGDMSDYGYYPYRYKQNNRLYNENLNYPFKGVILCTRAEKTIPYFIKYLIRRILLFFKIKK